MDDVNAMHKGGNLTYYKVRQRLIEYCLNIPYVSDVTYAYSHLSQDDDETITQYLVMAKVLLECIHHTTKLADIACRSWDNLYLMHGLKSPHTRKRVTMEQESWRTIEDVFQTIHCITKTEEKTRAYSEPNFEPVLWISTVSIALVSMLSPTQL